MWKDLFLFALCEHLHTQTGSETSIFCRSLALASCQIDYLACCSKWLCDWYSDWYISKAAIQDANVIFLPVAKAL